MLTGHIREVLEDRVLVRPTDGKVTLRERQASMAFEVADMPPSVTTIDIDQLVGKSGRLSGVKNGPWTKHCDYLLVCEDEGGEIAIFVELKKTLESEQKEKGMEQLRRSLPLLKYICSMCRIHQGMKPDRSRMDARYFLIGERGSRSLDKQRVKQGGRIPTEQHKNITVHIFGGPSVRFGRLRSA